MSEKETTNEQLTVEQRVLIRMRRVLAAVVRDVTPPPGMQSPLSPETIEEIRACFALISERERELGGKQNPDVPVFGGRHASTRVVDFKKPED